MPLRLGRFGSPRRALLCGCAGFARPLFLTSAPSRYATRLALLCRLRAVALSVRGPYPVPRAPPFICSPPGPRALATIAAGRALRSPARPLLRSPLAAPPGGLLRRPLSGGVPGALAGPSPFLPPSPLRWGRWPSGCRPFERLASRYALLFRPLRLAFLVARFAWRLKAFGYRIIIILRRRERLRRRPSSYLLPSSAFRPSLLTKRPQRSLYKRLSWPAPGKGRGFAARASRPCPTPGSWPLEAWNVFQLICWE